MIGRLWFKDQNYSLRHKGQLAHLSSTPNLVRTYSTKMQEGHWYFWNISGSRLFCLQIRGYVRHLVTFGFPWQFRFFNSGVTEKRIENRQWRRYSESSRFVALPCMEVYHFGGERQRSKWSIIANILPGWVGISLIWWTSRHVTEIFSLCLLNPRC